MQDHNSIGVDGVIDAIRIFPDRQSSDVGSLSELASNSRKIADQLD